jgi:hypothetical protein
MCRDRQQAKAALMSGHSLQRPHGRRLSDYSVPNSARRRTVEVHSTANEVRILEDGAVIAIHPVLDGRGQRHIIAGHRTLPPRANSQTLRDDRSSTARAGDVVALRPLAFYDAVGKRLAASDAAA